MNSNKTASNNTSKTKSANMYKILCKILFTLDAEQKLNNSKKIKKCPECQRNNYLINREMLYLERK